MLFPAASLLVLPFVVYIITAAAALQWDGVLNPCAGGVCSNPLA